VAAYPYSGPLVARLAQRYFIDGQTSRARNLVQQYRALFPEDVLLRGVQRQMDAAGSAGDSAAPSRENPVAPPR
jgi:hypothetical protein